MTTETDLTSTITDYATLLDGITADQASDPTPCTDYTVGQLRDHTVGWLTAFTDGFSAADGKCSDPQAVKVEGTGGDQVRALVPRLEGVDAGGCTRVVVLQVRGNDRCHVPSVCDVWGFHASAGPRRAHHPLGSFSGKRPGTRRPSPCRDDLVRRGCR